MIHRISQKGIDARLVASIHDEYQFEVARKDVPQFGVITRDAIKDTERRLRFKCPLDSTWKQGVTWTATH
jgi:DNA polymerase I-like protein with 3'-5' exonuclease and polymerase domains